MLFNNINISLSVKINGKKRTIYVPFITATEIILNTDNFNNIKKDIEVPNIEGLTIDEAKKRLKEVNLNISIEDMEEKEGTEIITQQLPKAGIKVKEGVAIIAYN